MKILIPHLNYTVTVKKPRKDMDSFAEVQPDGFDGCTLYIKRPVKDKALLAHELTHVLQFLCEERDIEMHKELEHMGYLMEWLMKKI